MQTSKAISTISYNTEAFLVAKLSELLKQHTIVRWYYVRHTAEKDEAKDHFHVYVEPNKRIDTAALSDAFRELDPKKPDKPLGVRPWETSKIDDWILYGLHDSAYLASKLESREFVYTPDDIKAWDDEDKETAIKHAYGGSDWAKSRRLARLLEDNLLTPYEAVKDGLVPLAQAGALVALQRLERNGRTTHTPKDNSEADEHGHPEIEEEWQNEVEYARRILERDEKKRHAAATGKTVTKAQLDADARLLASHYGHRPLWEFLSDDDKTPFDE